MDSQKGGGNYNDKKEWLKERDMGPTTTCGVSVGKQKDAIPKGNIPSLQRPSPDLRSYKVLRKAPAFQEINIKMDYNLVNSAMLNPRLRWFMDHICR
jgi:hypothetical protein